MSEGEREVKIRRVQMKGEKRHVYVPGNGVFSGSAEVNH